MSFDVNKFVNGSLKTPVQKIVDSVVSQVGSRATSIASDISETLFNIGQSFESISSLSAAKVDSIVSGSSADFVNKSSSDPAKQILNSSMLRGDISSDLYTKLIQPAGKIKNAKESKNQLVDRYPLDSGKYTIRFDFATYRRPSPFSTVESTTDYSVILPIPPELRERYSVDWEEKNLEAIGDIADALSEGGRFDREALTESGVQLGQFAGRVSYQAFKEGLGKNGGAIGTVLEQYFGMAPNPNITMAFKGPKLRDHTFTWKFHPQSPEESKKIKTIISRMKSKILPRIGANYNENAFLGYPSMVRVSMSPVNQYEIKTCIVDSITANYSVSGVPSFFKGTNLPTFINLSMSLKEIEYFVSEEGGYDTFNETAINLSDAITDIGKSFAGDNQQINDLLNKFTPTVVNAIRAKGDSND